MPARIWGTKQLNKVLKTMEKEGGFTVKKTSEVRKALFADGSLGLQALEIKSGRWLVAYKNGIFEKE